MANLTIETMTANKTAAAKIPAKRAAKAVPKTYRFRVILDAEIEVTPNEQLLAAIAEYKPCLAGKPVKGKLAQIQAFLEDHLDVGPDDLFEQKWADDKIAHVMGIERTNNEVEVELLGDE